jgi:hypothetical protein
MNTNRTLNGPSGVHATKRGRRVIKDILGPLLVSALAVCILLGPPQAEEAASKRPAGAEKLDQCTSIASPDRRLMMER